MTVKLNSSILVTIALAVFATATFGLSAPAEAQAKRWCGKDKRDGVLINTGGRKCLKVLKVYNRAVIADGYFRPYGSSCEFRPGKKRWSCRAGKYRTMSIEQFEFSRGYVYRKNGRLHAHVTYPSSWE
jgi:hypothetical protein